MIPKSPIGLDHRLRAAKETANTITAAVGLVSAIVGSVILLVSAVRDGTAWHIVSCTIYAVTLLSLYSVSTLYHGTQNPKAKPILMGLDHSAIFLLIAGTYTPFVLVNLRGPWGWSIFAVTWGLAIIGIIFESALRRRTALRVGIYLVMGWIMLVAINPLIATVAPRGLVLLLTGGLAYTLGVGFFAWHRLRYHHAIWHLFVLTGSAAHFFAILWGVIPPKVH